MGASDGEREGAWRPEDERAQEEARALAELLSGRRGRGQGIEPAPEPQDEATSPPSDEDEATSPPSDEEAPPQASVPPLAEVRAKPPGEEPATLPPQRRARRPLLMIGLSLLVLWAVAVPLAGAWVLQQERARVDVTVTRSAELQAQVSELRSELSILRAELGLLREELESLREVARAPNR